MDKSPYISRATLVIAPQRETLWCLRQRRWIIPPKKNPFIFFLVICVTFTLLRSYFSGKKEFQEKEKRKKEKNTKNEGKSLRVRQPDRCPRQSLLWQHGTFATMVHPAPVTFNSNHTRGSHWFSGVDL